MEERDIIIKLSEKNKKKLKKLQAKLKKVLLKTEIAQDILFQATKLSKINSKQLTTNLLNAKSVDDSISE